MGNWISNNFLVREVVSVVLISNIMKLPLFRDNAIS